MAEWISFFCTSALVVLFVGVLLFLGAAAFSVSPWLGAAYGIIMIGCGVSATIMHRRW